MRIPNYIKRLFWLFLILASVFILGTDTWKELNNLYKLNVDANGLAGEIIGGIATSVIIFFFYLLFTPIIEVSPKIVKYPPNDKYPDGFFTFKIYNSSIFAAYETKIYFVKVTPVKSAKGKNNVEVKGINVSLSYMEYTPSRFNRTAIKHGNTFAIIHRIEDDEIEKVLCDEKDLSYYRLTICTVGGVSGLRKIIVENYTYKSVKPGEFKSGATFDLI